MILRVLRNVSLVLLALVVTAVGFFALRSALSRFDDPPTLVDGRLRACGPRPNCVGSEGSDGNAVAALAYLASGRTATEAEVLKALALLGNCEPPRVVGDYWHARCVSAVFHFIDDVELRFDDGTNQVQIRSGSRVGYSDLGVNLERVNALAAALDAAR